MNEFLNVCLLNDSFPPVIDGVATAVLNYARVISGGLGGAVVATPSYPDAVDDYPFPVIRYPSVRLRSTAGYRMGVPVRAVHEIKKRQVDVIHSHCPAISAVLAKSLRPAVKAPVILTYHTKFEIDIPNAFKSDIMRATATRLVRGNIEACDEVWVVSRGAGESLRAIGYTGEYHVMPNGVDFPRGVAPRGEIESVSREHGLSGDVPVFLFVGRMMWYKGIRLILDGLALAKARGVRFKMLFVGGGTDCGEITEYAHRSGLMDDCIFTGPVRERERLRAYYGRADMFLFPSTFDTNGIVVREAAACGLASVLIKGSSAADDIEDGVTGMFIEEDAESLARAVSLVASNTEAVHAIGQRAMDTLYMSWDDAVGRAFSRYYDVCENYAIKQSYRKRGQKLIFSPARRYFTR